MLDKSNSRTARFTVIGTSLSFLFLMSCLPGILSADSDIKGAVLNIPTKIEKDVNVVIGKDNQAHQTSIITEWRQH